MSSKLEYVTVTFRIPKHVKGALERRAWLRSESLTTVLRRAIAAEVSPAEGSLSEGALHDLRGEVRDAVEIGERLCKVLVGIGEKLGKS